MKGLLEDFFVNLEILFSLRTNSYSNYANGHQCGSRSFRQRVFQLLVSPHPWLKVFIIYNLKKHALLADRVHEIEFGSNCKMGWWQVEGKKEGLLFHLPF